VSDTASPCGYGGELKRIISGSLYEMACSFRAVQDFRRRCACPVCISKQVAQLTAWGCMVEGFLARYSGSVASSWTAMFCSADV
jgi:hypothetical protein